MGLRVTTISYIDIDSEIRTLVSISNDHRIVQTIGSWKTLDPVLPEVIKACVYTLNAFGKDY